MDDVINKLISSSLANFLKRSIPGEQKNRTNENLRLQNRDICKQDTDILPLSLPIILSLCNKIKNECFELSKKV